ncbi:LacI family DNA-binding transcriptional regulator [Pseudomonas sp. S75]|uniref:LacI family DNA-binding transcriptional regulator n=1 Tax=unclassified Pseudomonas TaxID=196821 RepID=UPI001906235B|nr:MULTISPECIES: LacI family DNA-binding transcriptional regulator [unclassified Pseudomonas]MBJ9977573.1 LacI family DNA-binding transcriptional regulator [Pseudomonas sp. S30]MBK0155237.1 LacI family DNA-binding transcriptional regulator [Pseudomonas sp. S75]
MSERPPTSHDVAREAGVSQSAVSRVFAEGASVSPAMRARVEAAAARLGYRPSRLPAIMRSGKSDIVAVVIGGLYNPFHTMTLESFTLALAAAGKQTLVVRVDNDRDLDEALGELVSLKVDGVLSALSVSSALAAHELDRYRLPIVTLNSSVQSRWIRAVNSDNAEAGRHAAQLLHATGSRHFAGILGPADTLSHSARALGFATRVQTFGESSLQVSHGGYDYEWGRQEGTRLLGLAERPDGIFCGNDLIAFGLVDRWAEAGLYAPRDFRIIGYDNMPSAAWSRFALTSFDQNTDVMARSAIELLLRFDEDAPCTRVIEPRLVRRASC